MALSFNLIYHSLFPFDDEISHKAILPPKTFYSYLNFKCKDIKASVKNSSFSTIDSLFKDFRYQF